MTHRRTIFLAGMIGLFTASVGPAMADVYTATYTGFASGVDTNGVFGTAGATLSSVAYTSTYTYDPTQFGSAYNCSGSGYACVYGGSTWGVSDPILSASITINGRTYNQSSAFWGQQQFATAPGETGLFDYAESSSSNYLHNISSYAPVTPSFTAVQSFAITGADGASGAFSYGGEQISLSETYFAVTAGAPSPPATVPEPASLALLASATGLFAAAFGACRRLARLLQQTDMAISAA